MREFVLEPCGPGSTILTVEADLQEGDVRGEMLSQFEGNSINTFVFNLVKR